MLPPTHHLLTTTLKYYFSILHIYMTLLVMSECVKV